MIGRFWRRPLRWWTRHVYLGELQQRSAARGARLACPVDPPLFSLYSCLYEATPVDLFLETARSVFEQTYKGWEWIVLVKGAVPEALVEAAASLARDDRVTVITLNEYVGIVEGCRLCLEAARYEYIVPMDADDLLTTDALHLLAQAIHDHNGPGYLYTDEDHLVDGCLQSPFHRPDWDPLLNLCCSFIWHLTAFRRDDALRLGGYGDERAEWCHDWDTLCRFVADGCHPLHLPEVTYHWRHHAGSSTNTDEPETRSLDSQRFVLQREIDRRGLSDRYEILEFPVFRGAPEWHVSRREVAAPQIDLVLLGESGSPSEEALPSWVERAGFPFQSQSRIDVRAIGWVQQLARRARLSTADYVCLIDQHVSPQGHRWPWELTAPLELHPEVTVSTGRVLDGDGMVIDGRLELDAGRGVVGLDEGRARADAGPFAMALKSQTVGAANASLCLVRRSALISMLEQIPQPRSLAALGAWLGLCARRNQQRIAFVPLADADAGAGYRRASCLLDDEVELFCRELRSRLEGSGLGDSASPSQRVSA